MEAQRGRLAGILRLRLRDVPDEAADSIHALASLGEGIDTLQVSAWEGACVNVFRYFVLLLGVGRVGGYCMHALVGQGKAVVAGE